MNAYKEMPVLAIKGRAGAGKTSLARWLREYIENVRNEGPRIHVDHLAFALPLYELADIRLIDGSNHRDRQLYLIHDVLKRLFNGSPLYGAPPYDELIELVYYIQSIGTYGDKPRRFMLETAKLLREYNDDIFIDDLFKTAQERYRLFMNDYDEELDVDPEQYLVVISDLREEAHAEFVRKFKNSRIIEIDTPFAVRKERAAEQGDMMSYSEVEEIEDNIYNWSTQTVDKTFDGTVAKIDLGLEVAKYLEEEGII